MAGYVLGHVEGSGQPIQITDSYIVQHLLVCGADGKGKSHLLLNLAEQHIRMGRQLVILDEGDVLHRARAYHYRPDSGSFARQDQLAILDTALTDRVVCVNPVGRKPLDRGEQLRRLWSCCIVGSSREGLSLDAPPGTLHEAAAILEVMTEPQTYFSRSFLGNGEYVADIPRLLANGRSFIAHVPRERGSRLYGMLLMNEVLIGLEQVGTCPAPFLVFLDSGYAFFPPIVGEFLLMLTDCNIGLVLTFTYKELAQLREREKGLYSLLLDRCKVMAFGGDDDDPRDIVVDVTSRMFLPERDFFS